MNIQKTILNFVSLLIGVFISRLIDASMYETVGVVLFIYFVFNFIESIGNSYNILDIPILMTLFQLLIMPMIVYRVYNEEYFVQAFKYDMSVSEDVYYSFIVPASLLMIFGMKIPLLSVRQNSKMILTALEKSKNYLKDKSNIGITLMFIGIIAGFLQYFIKGSIDYIIYLLSKLLFVGIFYVIFSDVKRKSYYIWAGFIALLTQSLLQGMFGELIYTVLLGFLLYILGRKIRLSLKVVIATLGAVVVLLLQSIKADYRAVAWYGKKTDNQSNTEAFFSLLLKKVQDPSMFFDRYTMFPTVNRFNQGMIQGKVMAYMPSERPFAEGATIFNSVIASFVPRFLWPDKPLAGGHWNMEYFTGFIVEGYSMNVGPFGESYGNFGPNGGIYFMLLYGLFFNLAIYYILQISQRKPTIILWFPVLFLNSIQIETDILMTVNSLFKNALFIWLCYWGANRFLRINL